MLYEVKICQIDRGSTHCLWSKIKPFPAEVEVCLLNFYSLYLADRIQNNGCWKVMVKKSGVRFLGDILKRKIISDLQLC